MPGSASARMSLVARPGILLAGTLVFALRRGHQAAPARRPASARSRRPLAAGATSRGPVHPFFAIGLPLRQALGAQHQAARGGVHRDDSCGIQLREAASRRFSSAPGIIQSGISSVPISSRKVHAATSASACWSTQACATPTASLRTRSITPTRSVTLIAPRASSVLNRLEHFST